MKVNKISVRGNSCNFCKRGELNQYGCGLNYPYEYVWEFSSGGGGLAACICDDCLKELNTKVEQRELALINPLTQG